MPEAQNLNAPPPGDARSQELLERIRAAFVRKGFDGTSMQDLAREAGVAVGGFYRYFPSKTAIVEALVAKDIAEIEAAFDLIIRAPDPKAALRLAIARYMDESALRNGHLWAEISAAALRQSEIATTCQRMEETVADRLLRVFAKMTGLSAEVCAQKFTGHANYMALLVKCSGMSNARGPEPEVNALIRRSIDFLIEEVSSQTIAGA